MTRETQEKLSLSSKPGPQASATANLLQEVVANVQESGMNAHEAQPVLNLYYNQAQSRQYPKRGTASTKLALQSSTVPPASETMNFQN